MVTINDAHESESFLEGSLKNIFIKISYDGSAYSGWQRQTYNSISNGRTVQEEIEKALEKMHKHPVEVIGSGRTDSGVHASGQTANFYTDITSMHAQRFIPALNSLLPKDVRILESKEVPHSFHARFNARRRTYRYYIACIQQPLAHELPFVWHVNRALDIHVLNNMARVLYGELDCSTFTAAGDMSKTRLRYLYGAVFYYEGSLLVFEISANAFLWKMVRSIIGTLIYCEQKKMTASDFSKILHSCDRRMAGPTAPSNGLFLANVSY